MKDAHFGIHQTKFCSFVYNVKALSRVPDSGASARVTARAAAKLCPTRRKSGRKRA